MALDETTEFARLNALRRYAILDTPPENAFDRITELAADLLELPIAVVSFVDAHRIWYKSVHGPAQFREVDRAPGLCGTAIAHNGVYLVEHASEDPRTQEHPFVTGELGLEFYIGVPLKTHEGHVLGTLACMDTQPRHATREMQRLLETLAAIVMDEVELRRSAAQISRLSEALAESCQDMERRASFDALTGVLSRAAMLDRSHKLISRTRSGMTGAAILAIDIDKFKSVNDTYGHAAGDMVLKSVAGRMAGLCRGHDLLGRIGGEEFLAVFPEVTFEQARSIAERLRAGVAEEPVPLGDGAVLPVTISGGLYVIPPSDAPFSLPDAMKLADEALYEAKEAGRNRVVLSKPGE